MADTVELMRKRVLDMAFNGSLVTSQNFRATASNMPNEHSVKCQFKVPYTIPDSWRWVQLKEVANLLNGRAYKKHELLESGKIPVLRVGNFFTNNHWYYSDLELDTNKYCEKGDLLYAWSASFGPKIWDGPKAIYHYHIWKVDYFDLVERDFLYYWFLKDVNDIKSITTGSTMVHVTKGNMEKRLFPLPSIDEQKRIVAKIEEIFAVIDQIATKKEEALSIIRNLRQTALQDAIMGVLVDQEDTDEPASILYEKIQAEKEKLVKEKKIKKEKPLPEIEVDEIPFDIPKSWKWVRFNNILDIRDGTHDTPKYHKEGIPLITSKNLRSGDIDFTNIKYISEEDHRKISERSKADNGDILFAMIGTIGNPVLVNTENKFSIKNVALFKNYPNKNVETKYILYFLKAIKKQLKEEASGAVQSFLSLTYLRKLIIPLPPFEEQYRIVEKLDEIMAICDQMEAIFEGSSELKGNFKVV